jgi:hypothetical protein
MLIFFRQLFFDWLQAKILEEWTCDDLDMASGHSQILFYFFPPLPVYNLMHFAFPFQ